MHGVSVYGEEELSAFLKVNVSPLRKLAKKQEIDIMCIDPKKGKLKYKPKSELLKDLAELRRPVEPGEGQRSVCPCYDEDESPEPGAGLEQPEAGPSTRAPTPPRPRTRSSTRRAAPSSTAPPRTRARTRNATAQRTLSAMKPPPPPRGMRAPPGSPFAFLQNGIPRLPPRRRGVPLGALEDDSISSFSSTVDGTATRHGSPADASQPGEADTPSGTQQGRKLARTASRTVVPSSMPATQELPEVEEVPPCPPSHPAAAGSSPAGPGSRHATPSQARSRGDSGYTTPAAAHDSDSPRGSLQDERCRDQGDQENGDGARNCSGGFMGDFQEAERASSIPPNPVLQIDLERYERHLRARYDMRAPDMDMLVLQVQVAFATCFQKYWDAGLAFKVPDHKSVERHLEQIWASAAPGQIQYDLKSPKIREPAVYLPLPSQTHVSAYVFPDSQSERGEQDEQEDMRRRAPDSSPEAAASEAGSEGSARKRRREQDDAEEDAESVGSAGKRRRSVETSPKPKVDKGKGRAYD